jgi:hypothetical protein
MMVVKNREKVESTIDIMDSGTFKYLTGSLIFEKEEQLDLSNIPNAFKLLYHSKNDFRNFIKYLLDIYSKEYDVEKRLDFSTTIHPSLNQYFKTFLESTQEYVFFNESKKVILYLGFPNSKVVEFHTNTILESSTNCWSNSITFFLTYV